MTASVFLLVFLAVALSSSGHSILKQSAPVIDLGYAHYEGTYNATNGVTRFLGIRYAAAPTGPLRWEKPQRPAYTQGIQKADAFGDVCYIAAGFLGAASSSSPSAEDLTARDANSTATVETSEDCLFLNIWTPAGLNLRNHSLPVVVWIHGGGYTLGDSTTFDGMDLLNTAKNGIVVVTIQYRLGLFGFLPGTEIKKDGALNAGLLDQQFALEWVQEHISKFGGDSKRVTIWGESAGAGSVLQHLIANGGNTQPPLFDTAITSSTWLPSQYLYNDSRAELLYTQAVSQTGCDKTSDTLKCLRQADVALLQAANVNITGSAFFGTLNFAPVVDGTFIQQPPTEALKQHKVNGRALLSVGNANEGVIFVDPNTPADVNVTDYVKGLFPALSDAQADAAALLYKNVTGQQLQPVSIFAESILNCPAYYLLDAFNGNAYKGLFALPPALHGQDEYYYWTSLVNPGFPPPEYTNAVFTKAFGQAFIDFAISNDPNVKISDTVTPTWKHWEGDIEMVFNRTEAGEPYIHPLETPSALLERCRFWESVRTAARF